MAIAARLPFAAWRNEARTWTMRFVGLDLTGKPLRMQVRLQPNTPGAPLIDLGQVGTSAAEGLKFEGVAVENGLPVSTVSGRLNKTTMSDAAKVPYSGELGDNTEMAYAVQIDGITRVYGPFVALASVMDSDGAPTSGHAGYSTGGQGASAWNSAQVTFSDENVTVKIDGSDLIGPLLARAETAAARATEAEEASLTAQAAAGLAAAERQAIQAAIAGYPNGAALTIPVATRAILAAVANPSGAAQLNEPGREGVFAWSPGNNAANVTADPEQGIYVPPSSGPTGASGVWKRVTGGPEYRASWFGGKTGAALQAALDMLVREHGGGTVVLGGGQPPCPATINQPDNTTILGAGRKVTVLYAVGSIETLVSHQNGRNRYIKDVGFSGDSLIGPLEVPPALPTQNYVGSAVNMLGAVDCKVSDFWIDRKFGWCGILLGAENSGFEDGEADGTVWGHGFEMNGHETGTRAPFVRGVTIKNTVGSNIEIWTTTKLVAHADLSGNHYYGSMGPSNGVPGGVGLRCLGDVACNFSNSHHYGIAGSVNPADDRNADVLADGSEVDLSNLSERSHLVNIQMDRAGVHLAGTTQHWIIDAVSLHRSPGPVAMSIQGADHIVGKVDIIEPDGQGFIGQNIQRGSYGDVQVTNPGMAASEANVVGIEFLATTQAKIRDMRATELRAGAARRMATGVRLAGDTAANMVRDAYVIGAVGTPFIDEGAGNSVTGEMTGPATLPLPTLTWTPVLQGTGITVEPGNTFTTSATGWDKGAISDVTYAGNIGVEAPFSLGNNMAIGLDPTARTTDFFAIQWCWIIEDNQVRAYTGGAAGIASPVLTPGVSRYGVRRVGSNIEFWHAVDGSTEVVAHTVSDIATDPLYLATSSFAVRTWGPVGRT